MKLDFFRKDCQYPPINDKGFGLCDDQDGGKAYPDIANPEKWIAAVMNQRNLEVLFTAIDKCVLQDDQLPGQGRCDGMLTTAEHLYLVELKDMTSQWQKGAIEQLQSTIGLLRASHDISTFKIKKAFAANRRHSHFTVIDNELNKAFYLETGFRLDIQARILVV